jgi:3-methyladenine DNA glycosylase AlkD
MTAANRHLIEAMRAELARRADPEKAPGMQAYMKSELPFYGVQAAGQREAAREVFAAHPLDGFDEWHATVLALWDEARFREERYAAIDLTGDRRYRTFQTPAALPLYEQLIVTGAWWDFVDELATRRVGPIVRAHAGQVRPTVLAWSGHEDPWLRRTSIICQIGSKADTDTDLLYACIEPSFGDRFFFTRKAIGWALREHSKTDGDAVVRYVREHENELSPLSKREALKWLLLSS